MTKYAGFYANLSQFNLSVRLMFICEFSFLFIMIIVLYAIYIREIRAKNKIQILTAD